tara:strand:+ start:2682 stop:2900 length:219 start_codon:yes stop_codon:yes gene_type:complete
MKTKTIDFMDKKAMEKVGKEAVWVYKDVHKDLKVLSAQTGKPMGQLAEYFLKVGINSVKHDLVNVDFDVENL